MAPAAPAAEATLGLPAAPLLAAAPEVFAAPVPADAAVAAGALVVPELIPELIPEIVVVGVPAPLWLALLPGFAGALAGAAPPALAPDAGALAPTLPGPLAVCSTGPL
jgi:hypothetical protein